MKGPLDLHKPSPEFRERVELQIREACREESTRRVSLDDRWRRLKSAAVILLALGTGFSASVLSAQIQDNRIRDRLLAAERSELELARRRVEIARSEAAEVRQKVNVGLDPRDSLGPVEAEVQRMEAALARIQLNVEEIQATAQPPRDDLTAPRVGRRDFVTERLDLELGVAQKELTALEAVTERIQTQYNVGRIPFLAVLEAQADLGRARSKLEVLIGKRDLRQRHLQTPVDLAQLTRELTRLEVAGEIRSAEQQHEFASARLAHLRLLRNLDRASEVDVLRAQLVVADLEAELQQLRANLEVLAP